MSLHRFTVELEIEGPVTDDDLMHIAYEISSAVTHHRNEFGLSPATSDCLVVTECPSVSFDLDY